MKLTLTSKSWHSVKADLAILFVREGQAVPKHIENAADKKWLTARLKEDQFEGKAYKRAVYSAPSGSGARRWLVVGLGSKSKQVGESIRTAISDTLLQNADWNAKTAVIRMPEDQKDKAIALRAAVEGIKMGAYRFSRHHHDKDRVELPINQVTVVVSSVNKELKGAWQKGEAVADAILEARDWINEAPSRMTPVVMAKAAAALAKKHNLRIKQMGKAELKKIGMNALLMVSRGSAEDPRVVQLTYKPTGKKPSKKIVLVGKGVTFDSGGLNLKPGPSMWGMKGDMSGAAAVLATMSTLKAVGCPYEVHAFLGLTENMTGGHAYKPGDILDTYAGKTVEVGNTDAEGRLVMCDILAYAAKVLKPDLMIDVATLTGACVIALGTQAIGLFTRHDDLKEDLLKAAQAGGEKMWPLPMYDEYLSLLQKGPADLCNIGGRWGGAITAALFLGEFVPRDLPWAHLDIAGPAFQDNTTKESTAGGTGAAVRSLARWLGEA